MKGDSLAERKADCWAFRWAAQLGRLMVDWKGGGWVELKVC